MNRRELPMMAHQSNNFRSTDRQNWFYRITWLSGCGSDPSEIGDNVIMIHGHRDPDSGHREYYALITNRPMNHLTDRVSIL